MGTCTLKAIQHCWGEMKDLNKQTAILFHGLYGSIFLRWLIFPNWLVVSMQYLFKFQESFFSPVNDMPIPKICRETHRIHKSQNSVKRSRMGLPWWPTGWVHLPKQGTWVWFMVEELRSHTCHGATKPMCLNWKKPVLHDKILHAATEDPTCLN